MKETARARKLRIIAGVARVVEEERKRRGLNEADTLNLFVVRLQSEGITSYGWSGIDRDLEKYRADWFWIVRRIRNQGITWRSSGV